MSPHIQDPIEQVGDGNSDENPDSDEHHEDASVPNSVENHCGNREPEPGGITVR